MKQKDSTIQEILNYVQKLKNSDDTRKLGKVTGYTKEESDERYLNKKDGEVYQSKSDMKNYAPKSHAVPNVTEKDNKKVLRANYAEERKNSNTFKWDTINEVPTIMVKDDGKVLTAHKDKTYSWETPTQEVPNINPEDNKKVLTAIWTRRGSYTQWLPSPTIPDYSNCQDGDTLIVEDNNGTKKLSWAKYIPLTSNKEDIGKVLTVSYASEKVKTPNLAWKEIIPDYSKAKEGAVLTVKIVDGKPTLVWE